MVHQTTPARMHHCCCCSDRTPSGPLTSQPFKHLLLLCQYAHCLSALSKNAATKTQNVKPQPLVSLPQQQHHACAHRAAAQRTRASSSGTMHSHLSSLFEFAIKAQTAATQCRQAGAKNLRRSNALTCCRFAISRTPPGRAALCIQQQQQQQLHCPACLAATHIAGAL